MKNRMDLTLKEVKSAAKKTAQNLKGGEILALIGPLGSGKTAFSRHLGKALKVKTWVTSPTFNLMNVHLARLKNNKKVYFYHLDLYRTKNFSEIKSLGITELWGQKNTVTLIEWADKIKRRLPKASEYIYFSHEKNKI